MICPRCGHPNLPDRKSCSLCNTPLQGVVASRTSSGAMPSLHSPPIEPFAPITRPKVDTLVEPAHPFDPEATYPHSNSHSPPYHSDHSDVYDDSEVTFAGNAQQRASANKPSDPNLEWDMSEISELVPLPSSLERDTLPKGTDTYLGPQEPQTTEKHTAPGMLPYPAVTPPRRDSIEMTISTKGTPADHRLNEEYGFEIDNTPPSLPSPLRSPLRDTTPRPTKHSEHTFAQARPLQDHHATDAHYNVSGPTDAHYNVSGPTEEVSKDQILQGLTVPAVPSASFIQRPEPPPTLEEPNPLRTSSRQTPPLQPHPISTLPPAQPPSYKEQLAPIQNDPSPLLPSTAQPDMSLLQQQSPIDNIRPEQSTLRDEPMTAHAPALSRKPLPKPRIKPNFVFAAQLNLPSLWRRAIAAFIDLSLLSGLSFLFTRLFGPALTKSPPPDLHPLDLLVFVLEHYGQHVSFGLIAFSLLYILYSMLGLLLWRGSLGKSLLGLEVLDRSGKKLGLLGAMVRSIAFLPSFFLGLFGVLWILMDGEYRSLYDRVAGSVVVSKQN